jgi:type IV secretory pathway protease TraF
MIRTGRSDRLRQTAITLGAATALVVLAFLSADTFGLRLNLSPSLPLGIYVVTRREDTAAPEPVPTEPHRS